VFYFTNSHPDDDDKNAKNAHLWKSRHPLPREMAVTPKANLKTSSSAFGWSSFFHHPSRGKKRNNRIFVFVLFLVFLVCVLLKTTSFSSYGKNIKFRVRIRRRFGGFLSATRTISKTKKNVLDEVKHFAQFHQHTTFQRDEEEEEEEENHGNERREEEGEHEREAVIAHDLPQSTVDAHLDETDDENRSRDGSGSGSGSGSETTSAERERERNEDSVATVTAATGNKPHLARGWLVSKLPFDVDQPGSERTALEANFNGSVPLLTHRGIFKYDPTPRVDGMNYYRRVYAVTQVGMAQDLPNWKSVGEADMEATANSRRWRSLLRHRNSEGSEGAADADVEALAAEAETVIDESDDVGFGLGGDSSDELQQQQQQQHVKIETAGAGLEEALRSKPPGTRGLTFRITKHLYDALPPRDPSWRYKTCAVVGNGGALLTSRHGKDIDAHDAVLRMNNAPVGGRFTDYVGSKTTFNMINFHWAREITQRTPVVETDAFLVMYESVLHTLRNQLYPKLLRMQAQGQLPVVPVLTSPDFTVKGYGIWLQLKDVLEQRRAAERREKNEKLIKEGKAVEQLKHPGAYKRKPMSGFFAMLFMLNLCDSVDMYGFSNWRPSRSKIPYHYFDKVKGTTAVHSFDLSMEVFMEIAKAHDVNMIDSEGKSTKLNK